MKRSPRPIGTGAKCDHFEAALTTGDFAESLGIEIVYPEQSKHEDSVQTSEDHEKPGEGGCDGKQANDD